MCLTTEKIKRDISICHENIEALYRSRKSHGDGSINDTRAQHAVDNRIIRERILISKLDKILTEMGEK